MSTPFGKLVKEARESRNLSQRALAQRIGMSPTYISYVESGKNPSSKQNIFQPGVEQVDKIARVLGIDQNQARLAAGYAPSDAELYDVLKGVTIMFQDESHLTPEQKEKIMDMVRVITAGVIEQGKE